MVLRELYDNFVSADKKLKSGIDWLFSRLPISEKFRVPIANTSALFSTMTMLYLAIVQKKSIYIPILGLNVGIISDSLLVGKRTNIERVFTKHVRLPLSCVGFSYAAVGLAHVISGCLDSDQLRVSSGIEKLVDSAPFLLTSSAGYIAGDTQNY